MNYVEVNKQLAVKISAFYLLALILIASTVMTHSFTTKQTIVVMVLMVPQLFVVTILVVFNFYIELVNFQLKNLAEALIRTFASYDNVRNEKNRKNKILTIRQCYLLICQISKLVNKVLRYSILLVVVILIIGLVNKTYENLIQQIIERRTKKILGKVHFLYQETNTRIYVVTFSNGLFNILLDGFDFCFYLSQL